MTASRSRRPIVALLAANAISMTGNVAALVAIPWFVLTTTGSPSKTGVTASASLLPVVLSGVFGGALVDRVGYRRTSILADVASGVAVAAIPVLHATVGLTFPALVALVFVGGLLDAPGTTARSALVPDAAAVAGWTLERASGLSAVVERTSRLAGAPFAGILIAVASPTSVLWIDAATFAVSAAIVAAGVPTRARAPREDRQYLRELRDGFAFLRADRTLAVMITIVTLTNLLDSLSFVILPVYAREVYRSSVALGLMYGLMGAGSVMGALAFAVIGNRLSRRAVFAWGFVVVCAWYFVGATFPPLAVFLAARVVAGLASGPINPVIDTVFYERTPDGIRGRVFGVSQAASWVAMPLGVLLAGSLVELAGLRAALLSAGTLYLAITVTATMLPALRGLDRLPSTPVVAVVVASDV